MNALKKLGNRLAEGLGGAAGLAVALLMPKLCCIGSLAALVFGASAGAAVGGSLALTLGVMGVVGASGALALYALHKKAAVDCRCCGGSSGACHCARNKKPLAKRLALPVAAMAVSSLVTLTAGAVFNQVSGRGHKAITQAEQKTLTEVLARYPGAQGLSKLQESYPEIYNKYVCATPQSKHAPAR